MLKNSQKPGFCFSLLKRLKLGIWLYLMVFLNLALVPTETSAPFCRNESTIECHPQPHLALEHIHEDSSPEYSNKKPLESNKSHHGTDHCHIHNFQMVYWINSKDSNLPIFPSAGSNVFEITSFHPSDFTSRLFKPPRYS